MSIKLDRADIERLRKELRFSAKYSTSRGIMGEVELDLLCDLALNGLELPAKQAQIDRLMLEHCPDEMTEEQRWIWAEHQKQVPETATTDLRRTK